MDNKAAYDMRATCMHGSCAGSTNSIHQPIHPVWEPFYEKWFQKKNYLIVFSVDKVFSFGGLCLTHLNILYPLNRTFNISIDRQCMKERDSTAQKGKSQTLQERILFSSSQLYFDVAIERGLWPMKNLIRLYLCVCVLSQAEPSRAGHSVFMSVKMLQVNALMENFTENHIHLVLSIFQKSVAAFAGQLFHPSPQSDLLSRLICWNNICTLMAHISAHKSVRPRKLLASRTHRMLLWKHDD